MTCGWFDAWSQNKGHKAGTVNTLDWLSPNVRSAAVKHSLKPGDVLFRAGGRVAGLYEVVSGVVRLVRVLLDAQSAGLQAALYSGDPRNHDRLRSWIEDADLKNLAGVLSTRHHRPRRCTAETTEKFPPPHVHSQAQHRIG
jgi:CRP-like cAMP-binding protein